MGVIVKKIKICWSGGIGRRIGLKIRWQYAVRVQVPSPVPTKNKMGDDIRLYVAYGSNMNLGQMSYRCPCSKRIGVGKIKGWKLIFNVHADVIKTNNEDDAVPVVIWDIADED